MTWYEIRWVPLAVLLVFFAIATFLGFIAVRWNRGRHGAGPKHSLEEWSLGGRGFGTVMSWFLLGGNLYTAYTFVAIPAAMYATGSVNGFFAVPYTIVVYPLVFVLMPRLWSVAHRHGYLTPADFVRGRYDNRGLALAVALTGILATLPYIALQIVGIQAVLEVIGLGGGNVVMRDLPLFFAFTVLAALTYFSGVRGPALIAVLKAFLVFSVVIVASIYLPYRLGGFSAIFTAAEQKMTAIDPQAHQPARAFIPGENGFWPYATLALGSAMALFMYPHAITAVLSAKSRDVVRRNAILLPICTFALGLLALFGFMAITAQTRPTGMDGTLNQQLVVPQLFADQFPGWFAGVAFAAIVIGALVPAAMMSIAATNLFTRNIYREFINRTATPVRELQVSRRVSLLVKLGALVFVVCLDRRFAVDFQLLGGIWILQTFPALASGLYTRWFHPYALLAGWAVGMTYGTVVAYNVINPTTANHFGGALAGIPLLGQSHVGYIALTAFAINAVVAVALTLLLRLARVPAGGDRTRPGAYHADTDDPRVEPIPELFG